MDLDALTRNFGADAIAAMLDFGGAGTLKVFAGAKPAHCSSPDPVTLLSVHTLSDPAFANAGTGGNPDGQATANPIGDDVAANASGEPGCFRLYDHAGNCRMQGTAGVGSGELSFDRELVQGLPVSVSGLTLLLSESTGG